MSISRSAFEFKLPGRTEIGARQIAEALKDLDSAAMHGGKASERMDAAGERRVVNTIDSDGMSHPADPNAPESPPTAALNDLPPTDAASAGDQDGIGPTQPESHTHRSVATGRDAPQIGAVGREDTPETEAGATRSKALEVERRIQGQASAAAEELAGIHSVMERLLELTEGHIFEDGQKLRSLENKIAQLEMQWNFNRNSP